MGKVIIMCLVLTGCATTKAGNFCDVSSGPWRPSKAQIAKMSQKMVDKMLSENRYGAKHCGW